MSSVEGERSLSCLRHADTHNHGFVPERLGNFGVVALHGFDIPINIDEICETFKVKTQVETTVLLFYVIDEISSLPHTFYFMFL